MDGLPPRPNPYQASQPSNNWQNVSATAQAVSSALANPYAAQNSSVSSHYAQAYARHFASAQTTAEGYTYSTSYTPLPGYDAPEPGPSRGGFSAQAFGARGRGSSSSGSTRGGRGRGGGGRGGNSSQTHWYSPGNVRCSKPGCAFTGSAKSVETHQMDRHLIYPPGWKEQKKEEWDADPSLKGKSIPIQGTSQRLETPEEIAAWVEERRRRFPTSGRVEEKKRRLDEAVARGQLHPDDPALRGNKRRRLDDGSHESGGGRGGERGRGSGRGRGRGSERGGRGGYLANAAANVPALGLAGLPPKPSIVMHDSSSSSSSESEDDDEPPEEASSRAAQPVESPIIVDAPKVDSLPTPAAGLSKQPSVPRPRATQPRKPPANPFAPKSSLLRDLLSTEIRMTVSNLSQAIHFLVDNDFLEGVELRPGEADEKLIEVLEESASADLVDDRGPSLDGPPGSSIEGSS